MRREGTPGAILSHLRDGPRQAQDLAATLGIDTSAVRRHLESLRHDGLVETDDVVSGPGRPKRMYALSAAGRETFQRDYALLLDLLIGKLGQTHGRELLEEVAGAIAQDLAQSATRDVSAAQTLDALVAFYTKLGFDASLERTADGVFLVQRNCIFLKTATADPALMCQCLDEGIIRGALPTARVDLEGSLATGSTRCRHRITLPGSKTLKPRS